MIINYQHIKLILDNGRKNATKKRSYPIYKVECDLCGKIFEEKNHIFDKRKDLLGIECCGQCARPINCSLAGKKAATSENSGRFTSEKWKKLSPEELKIRTAHNKKIAENYHLYLDNNPSIKDEFYRKIHKNSKIGYISKAQEEIFNILNVSNYGFELDGVISSIKVDILHINEKIAIEYNGDYWHCNPLFWKADRYHKVLNMTASEKWNKDENRINFLKNSGYEVYVIWEYDWIKNKQVVMDLLKNIIKKHFLTC